jgi:glycosyltransferase involved in cell wall biosynthesis
VRRAWLHELHVPGFPIITGDLLTVSNSAPRVSVLVPAWNAARTLTACLNSLQRQTLTSWQCVVVDDGSSDATAAVFGALAAQDPRFTLVSTPRRGLVHALNEGLGRCHAPLIARMDADDVMHPERLAAQVRALEDDATLAAVGCHVRIFPRATMSPRLHEYEAWLNGMQSADDVTRDVRGMSGRPPDPDDAARDGEPELRIGPRSEIRDALASMHFVEGRDFVCAA